MTSRRRNRYGAAVCCSAVIALGVAVPAAAAGTLSVSKSTGLAVGDKVTVSAKGLSPNQGFVPIGLCKPEPVGPTDCETSPDAAIIGRTDAAGVWHSAATDATTAQITIKAKAGGADCLAKAGNCVIAVSISAKKELVQVPLTIGPDGGNPTTAPPTSTPPTSPPPATTGGSGTSGGSGTAGDSGAGKGGTDTLPQTGSTDGMAVTALVGGTAVLFGGCTLVLLRRRSTGR
ncbi:neocarzinostatin apoprotein domain-containing protein [Streptomyces sp. NPDC058623]|uniref:neocarzinostatin apoprotein domain-containing protein n=1 Tax=Streptomyces sp. NPDC058623 TaxID=3346563 RepID=UPI0036615E8B